MRKNKKEKIKWISWNETRAEFEKLPGWKEADEANELEFQIVDALIQERIKHKLTQRQIAAKIGIAQSALARFESGRTNPTLSLLQKIAAGLGLVITVRPSKA